MDESYRDSAGRFGPGNPGRPKGSRNAVRASLDRVAEGRADEILSAVVAAALKGDGRCADIVLKRIWPEPKGRTLEFSLPPITGASDAVGAIGAIISAVAAGELSPEEATQVAGLLEMQRRIIEVSSIEERIQALEKAQRGRQD